MPKLNLSIDIGHILTIVAILIGIGISYGQIQAKLDEVASLRSSIVELARSVDQLRLQLAGETIERRSWEGLHNARP